MENLASEYLQSLNPSGLPPAKLELKIGLPVMLLKNLNPERGLCNGTRLIICEIGQYVLKVKILGGCNDRIDLIPRFTLSTLPGDLPFILTRKQFPIKVSFTMTINKSQGQSLKKVAVDLRESAFTHGQLYVALSRSTSADGVTVLLSSDQSTGELKTDNVVYLELLANIFQIYTDISSHHIKNKNSIHFLTLGQHLIKHKLLPLPGTHVFFTEAQRRSKKNVGRALHLLKFIKGRRQPPPPRWAPRGRQRPLA